MRAGKVFGAVSAGTIASLVIAASASAAAIQVTDPGDAGTGTTCTLRQAIASANNDNPGTSTCIAGSGLDQITFTPAAVAPLALTGELAISSDLDIVGPGMNSLTISGDTSFRVFNVTSGTVTISGLTVTGGNPAETSFGMVQGGCILNAGNLTLNGIRVTDCTAALTGSPLLHVDGGGIASHGSLTLTNSLVDGNHGMANNTATDQADVRGAGIYADGVGGMTIDNSTISDNDATATGATANLGDAEGGIEAGTDVFTIKHSTIAGNTASATVGGGSNIAAGGLTVTSPLATASTVELSTIAGNVADATGVGATAAGGVYLEQSTLNLRSSTLALNGPTTGAVDGANLIADDSGVTTLSNTLVANPRGGGKNCLITLGSTIASGGFNDDFSSPGGASCFMLPSPSDLTSDPLLSPAGLAGNGGPTETLALQPTSPMIDAGSNAGDTDTSQDQRGLTRPVDFPGLTNAFGGNGTDIGAFEFQATCAGQATPGGSCPSPTPTTPSPGPTPRPPPAAKKCKKHKRHASAAKKCKKHKKHRK